MKAGCIIQLQKQNDKAWCGRRVRKVNQKRRRSQSLQANVSGHKTTLLLTVSLALLVVGTAWARYLPTRADPSQAQRIRALLETLQTHQLQHGEGKQEQNRRQKFVELSRIFQEVHQHRRTVTVGQPIRKPLALNLAQSL
ncbi:hypothetical protein LAZ67_12002248 [Cordylochernes scorpioides]|uniref:Uncharacterized protein n=1 Tax=Cordylochernes scorpioides TaxID=51811 RepID=A0ABY6L1N0_9ARAC|nr:hypothetical protein LAZ67_12002248 [Cordylochernes scorpioides]